MSAAGEWETLPMAAEFANEPMRDGDVWTALVLATLAVLVMTSMARIITVIRPALTLLGVLVLALVLILVLGAQMVSSRAAEPGPTRLSLTIPPTGQFLPR